MQSYHAVDWLDHREARIFHFNPDDFTREIVRGHDQHLHHMLKRSLGVKGAVFVLYGIAQEHAKAGAANGSCGNHHVSLLFLGRPVLCGTLLRHGLPWT